MASPDKLKFAQLLAPIPGENPAGANLCADVSPGSAISKIREARSRANQAERQAERWAPGGSDDQKSPPDPTPDWVLIVKHGTEVLEKVSKDYQVTTWLIEALTRLEGFAGLRDGLRLARELGEQYWDHLYPLPDAEEGGVAAEARITPLRALNGVLVKPIQRISFTNGDAPRHVSRRDFIDAEEVEGITDPDKKARRIEQMGPDGATMDVLERLMQTAGNLPTTFEDIAQCLEELEKLGKVLEDKCSQSPNGGVPAAPTGDIRKALEGCRETIERFVTKAESPETTRAAQDGGPASSTDEGPAEPGGMTRKKALKQLGQVAQYFKRAEPHSPLGYALERWATLAERPLPQLLTELGIIDEPTRKNLATFVGISVPPQSDAAVESK